MASKATFVRGFHPNIGAILIPSTDEGREIIGAMKFGDEVMMHVHVPRNPKHHRMLFVLLRKVIDAGAWGDDQEALLDWVKMRCGLVERRVDAVTGNLYYRMKSISFESMGQEKFSRFFDRAVWHLSTKLLDNDDWQALRDEVAEIVDGDYGRQLKELDRRYNRSAS